MRFDEPAMANTYQSIYLHITFGTRHRTPVLADDVRPDLFAYMGGAIRGAGCRPIAVGGWVDHVHLLLSPGARFVLEDFVKETKRSSNSWLRARSARLSEFHWQRGYGAFSIARWDLDKVTEYVRNQEEHHRAKSFAEEYRQLLERHGIEFDEKYVLD